MAWYRCLHPGNGLSPTVFLLSFLLGVTAVSAAVTVPDNPSHAWKAPLAKRSLLLAIDRTSSALIVAGERGHILTKQLNNKSWEQAQVPTQALLTSITMLDGKHGWAVGHDAVILHTEDGGASWVKQFEAPGEQRPLMDIRFEDLKHGVAIGAYGYFLQTNDGGKTWESRLIHDEHDFHLNAVSDRPEGNRYIAAEAGYVYRTKDKGETWDTLNPSYEGSFFDVVSLGDDKVMVVGLRGHAFISHDAGDTWEPVNTGTQVSLNAITQLKNGQVLIAGHAGMLLLSDKTFQRIHLYQFPDRKALSDVIETSANQVEIVGESGVISVNLCQIFQSDLVSGCQ